MHLPYSDHHEAAWLYYALPLPAPGPVLMGALKAVFARFVLPATALIALVALLIWGLQIWLDVLLAAGVTLLVSCVSGLMLARRFPFSQAFALTEGSGRVIWSVLVMAGVAVLGGVHYLLTLRPTWMVLFLCLVL